MIFRLVALVAAVAALSVSTSFGADITVGFVTSLSGPRASIGIPYEQGILASHAYAEKIGGDPQRPQTRRRRKGRCADGHVGRSRHDRDDGGRRRDQDSDEFTHTNHAAAKPKRPVAHFHSTAAAPDGRRGGRAHEKG